ncbi:hypothetical protein KC345_g6914 [Hortaea werneckii]|nr:hypothetical protein KC345_g6914 [Hortaea werneckii]
MLSFCWLALAAGLVTHAAPFTYIREQRSSAQDQDSTYHCPVKVAKAELLGDVQSDLPVGRDLGFVGKLQDTMIFTYGDLVSQAEGEFYMTSDSSSIGTDDPLLVRNTQRTEDGNHPTDMIAPHAEWNEKNTEDAFGGTNVVPTGHGYGMMFFLKNHRPDGNNTIIGAGVAHVRLSSPDINVTSERLAEYWWDTLAGEPNYGDIGASADGNYIYGYGHGGDDLAKDDRRLHVFLARAPILGWTDLQNWEYWHASTNSWEKTRMVFPGEEDAIQRDPLNGAAWAVAQGQMVWNPYYRKIFWMYTTPFADNDRGDHAIVARTADRPEGPWSQATTLYRTHNRTPGQFVYCAVANPYLDETGRSLVVTVNVGSMTVQAHRVVFE